MQELLTFLLMGGSALLTAGAVAFLGVGLYTNVLERFLTEVRDESAGGVKGAGSVAVRKLGAMNRRFMWPGYESKTRRKLIKAGEPSQYKPEDIMALQEVSAFLALLAGLFVVNGLGGNLAWSLLVMLLGLFYPLIWLNDQVKRRHLAITARFHTTWTCSPCRWKRAWTSRARSRRWWRRAARGRCARSCSWCSSSSRWARRVKKGSRA